MRSIITSFLLALALPLAAAPSRINPFNQIDWNKVSGAGAPSATCSATLYGMPYTNTTNGNFYVCAVSGWVLVSGGGGSSVSVNGVTIANPNFNDTTPAAGTNGKNAKVQVTGSDISIELVGDGTVTHFLNGTGTYTTPAGGGTIGGSGTTNTLPKFTSSTDIGDSDITDDGTTVAIGKPTTVGGTAGVAGVMQPIVGTDPGGAAGYATYTTDTTNGYAMVHEGVAAASRVCTAANAATNTGCGGGGSGDTLISRVSCVTYGCVADGSVTGNTGTDNTTPFTNCLAAAVTAKGYCYVPTGVYKIATSLPTISVGGTGFVGDVYGFSGGTNWVGPSTVIFSASSSATILTISSGLSTYITGDHLENIALQRSTGGGTGSIALLLDHAAGAYIGYNNFNDSAIGMDITNSPSFINGIIEHNNALWGWNAISCGAATTTIGF